MRGSWGRYEMDMEVGEIQCLGFLARAGVEVPEPRASLAGRCGCDCSSSQLEGMMTGVAGRLAVPVQQASLKESSVLAGRGGGDRRWYYVAGTTLNWE
ncbi:hypothetical protein IMZ48_01965 [Candidatus Bathyarchaeota archaeon]|nr:hypothetical protein [Candidatus Bathyarchaeota archaeon]